MQRINKILFCNVLSVHIHIAWTFLYMNEIGAQQSLNGKTLRMAADHWEPWSIVPEVSGLPSYTGVSWKILEYLQNSLNFSTIITRSPDGSWGSPDENGLWGGMVGLVKRNEVDFGLGTNHTSCDSFLKF